MHRRLILGASGLIAIPVIARGAELFVGGGSNARPVDSHRLGERRELQIRRVEAYARRGVFPMNVDFQGTSVPYFVDRRGVACAVAHLMTEDGLGDAVRRIARANNHVRVMEVTEGPLVDWVLGSGLLQEEAARVQPSYFWLDPEPIVTPDPAIVERNRVQQHLYQVVRELRRDTVASLRTAEQRVRQRNG